MQCGNASGMSACGRCFRAVDPISETPPKLIAIDEETDHEIVHGRRFGKADRAAYKPLDSGAQIGPNIA